MARQRSLQRKRRTREHVIADLSVNHVERQVLLCGYTLERIRYDYGLDLILSTFTSLGEAEYGEIYLQVKSTDRLHLVAGGQAIAVRVDRADLFAWSRFLCPVILVVYDAQADTAYWLYIQAHLVRQPIHLSARSASSVTVHVPVVNVLDQAAIRTFARLRDRIHAQVGGRVQHEE